MPIGLVHAAVRASSALPHRLLEVAERLHALATAAKRASPAFEPFQVLRGQLVELFKNGRERQFVYRQFSVANQGVALYTGTISPIFNI